MIFTFSDLVINMTRRMVKNQRTEFPVRNFCRNYIDHEFDAGFKVLPLQRVDTVRALFVMLGKTYPDVFRYDTNTDTLVAESITALQALYDKELLGEGTAPLEVWEFPYNVGSKTRAIEKRNNGADKQEIDTELLLGTVASLRKEVKLLAEQVRSLTTKIEAMEVAYDGKEREHRTTA